MKPTSEYVLEAIAASKEVASTSPNYERVVRGQLYALSDFCRRHPAVKWTWEDANRVDDEIRRSHARQFEKEKFQ